MHMEQVYKQWNNEKSPFALEKENYKVFEFPMNNFCYFEIRAILFEPHHKASKLNKRHFCYQFQRLFDWTRANKIDVPKIDLNEPLLIHLVPHPWFVQKYAIPIYSMM